MNANRHHIVTTRSIMNEKGFTLIEVIVALAVLTIGILAVNAMQTASIRGNKTANDITKATSWSADELERIWRIDYDDLSDTDDDGVAGLDDPDPGAANPAAPDAVVANDPSGDFTIVYNVAEDYPMDNIKTIHAIVSWGDKSVTIRHKKAKYM